MYHIIECWSSCNFHMVVSFTALRGWIDSQRQRGLSIKQVCKSIMVFLNGDAFHLYYILHYWH